MFVAFAVLFAALKASAQEQSLSTVTPPHSPPFLDLFTSASNYFSEPIRKSYSPSENYVSCPKPDSLTTFANVLGSAAKIMISATVILVLKVLMGKLLFMPVAFVLLVKLGLKTFLLWPMLTKMIKYFKKKKKGHKSRNIMDCSSRISCVIQRATNSGWTSNLGSAAAFSLIDDIEEDNLFAKSMLTILAGDNVAECMSLECSSGIDIS